MITIIALYIILGIILFIVVVLHFSIYAKVHLENGNYDFKIKFMFFTFYPRKPKKKKSKRKKKKKETDIFALESENNYNLFNDDLGDDFIDEVDDTSSFTDFAEQNIIDLPISSYLSLMCAFALFYQKH